MSNILNLIQCVVDSAEEKNSSFAIFGLCIGLCELQMCCLCVGISYFLVANCPILLSLFHLAVTVGTCCRGGFRSAFLSEGHGTAKRESAVGVPPNPALQYVLCYALIFILHFSMNRHNSIALLLTLEIYLVLFFHNFCLAQVL